MKIDNNALPAVEDGTAVTASMLDEWCEAYDNEMLPEGYRFDGSVRPERPRRQSSVQFRPCRLTKGQGRYKSIHAIR